MPDAKIALDLTHCESFINESAFQDARSAARTANSKVHDKTGAGSDFLGWVNLPNEIPGSLLEEISNSAQKIKEQSEILVVIGIGGSYLGAKAVIDALSHSFRNNLSSEQRDGPEIYFA
ncbi:MAG: glucose-6-phosphate isomerase, partial [Bacteroidia bacterium]|nr:glucose-6-phosphate isomerase [Bacteroidia bacterium]